MKILFVSAEVAPYVSVGGLSQVMYFLPRALHKMGHDVRIFTAKHGAMDNTFKGRRPWPVKSEIKNLPIPIYSSENPAIDGKNSFINCSVSSFARSGQPKAFFLENKEYFKLRANVFGYRDDHVRFDLLSKGCLEWLLTLHEENGWWPDVICVNDWHTGYFVELARKDTRYSEVLGKTPLAFLVHNFFYQGNLNFRYLPKGGWDDGRKPLVPLNSKKLLKQNALLRGITYCDGLCTVSATHAKEILTPEYAEGLDKVLKSASKKLFGILNGLDTKEFDPEKDPIIRTHFNEKSFLHARAKNKTLLQKEFGLAQNPNKPLIAVCGRISTQKGWELILEMLPHLLAVRRDVQFLVMGQGDERYQNQLTDLQRKFGDQLALHLQTNFRLPRRIYAGADMVLIPSIFEPGGIVALESLRYGSVPIVRRTGGLNDIITEFDPNLGTGNGFSFKTKDAWSLFSSILTALVIYNQPKHWKKLVGNCLSSDFSWEHSAALYEKWFEKTVSEFESKEVDKEITRERRHKIRSTKQVLSLKIKN